MRMLMQAKKKVIKLCLVIELLHVYFLGVTYLLYILEWSTCVLTASNSMISFFMQAKAICPSDPLVYNELGVVAYHMKEYKKVEWCFKKTLAHIPSPLSEMCESAVVNLAHTLRKLKCCRGDKLLIYPFHVWIWTPGCWDKTLCCRRIILLTNEG
ncbi:unnamed protein product [Lactuca virosa]|uniref:Uncharacterized protein n=1 Tax=Lactuca virosa TaxID=75947 RepID=A0AAU9LZS3_9ASTR|nr:unnamed protein product [Lactuca virosa]